MTRADWLALLALSPDEVPRLLVLEGTWWRGRALQNRLALLTDVRETGMPDLWWGRLDGEPVAYCPAYGATRAVEPVHALGTCGTALAVQIGSCGGLQPYVRTGDVVVPARAVIEEGASRHYGGSGMATADAALVSAAALRLEVRGLTVHTGTSVTTSALLAQPPALTTRWAADGLLGVDLETSAVLSAAASLRVRAAAMLFVWDELPHRSWTDAFTPTEREAQLRAEEAVFEVALSLLSAP